MKRLPILLLYFLLAISCIENPDTPEESQAEKDPILAVKCEVVGSYSANLVCTIEGTSRFFIGGGFYYSKDPDFQHSGKIPGMVLSNELTCTVTDLEPDSEYYVKAYVFDVDGSFESGTVSFSSPSFEIGPADFHIGYEGGPIELLVTSNTDFMVYTEADWISGADTRSGSTFSREVYVEPNMSLESRTATLTVCSPDSYFREKVTVQQNGAPLEIGDRIFKDYLLSHYDSDKSGEIELAEIPEVTVIELHSDQVTSMSGLEHFHNLKVLVCSGESAGQLTEINLSGNPLLEILDLSVNQLKELDVSCCPNLKDLRCQDNRLKELDLRGNEPLVYLDCSRNELQQLDFADIISLEIIHCDDNGLNTFKSPRSNALAELTCSGNALEAIDLSNNKGLHSLDCARNQLTELKLIENSGLVNLNCSENQLKELPLRRNTALETLYCRNNLITALDLRFNPTLKVLDCSENQLSELDLTGNPILESLDCGQNGMASLDVSFLQKINMLKCSCQGMVYVLMSREQSIEGITSNRSPIHIDDHTEIFYQEDLATIKDPVFNQYLLNYYDSDGDGRLSKIEAALIVSVNIETDQVKTLEGIEYLSGLKYLKCEGTVDATGRPLGRLTSLNLSKNHKLEQVLCGNNNLKEIDVSGCPALRTLWCFNNQLTMIDVSGCPVLADLNVERNLIPSLDLNSNSELISLDCSPMAGKDGLNLLREVRIPRILIDYINGQIHSRSVTNIPPRTDLFVDNTLLNALPSPFMFNFNAKEFSVEGRIFPYTPGAEWKQDLVLEGNGVYDYGDYVRIKPGTHFRYSFGSTSMNPFNRNGMDELTIIAKVRGTDRGQFSIFACRSETSGYNYMFREGDNSTEYFYLHDSRAYGSAVNITVSTLPNIVVARAAHGNVWMESYTDNIAGSSKPISWGGESDSVNFFYGGCGGEYWSGHFYWIYLSLKALTEEEIRQVIEYNEF